jgi:hypothetical protein
MEIIMRASSAFGDVLEAADRLTLEERESLIEVLQKRAIEDRRAQIEADIRAARREFAAGKCKPVAPGRIVRDMLK